MNKTMTDVRIVEYERELPFPREKIWRALTEPHLLAEWLMKTDFAPVVGRPFQFRTDAQPHWNGLTDCEVLTVEPYSKLSYTWNSSGEEAANGLKTVVTWTLVSTRTGTLLRVEQAGFREDQLQNYQGAQYGWRRFLSSLEQILGHLD